MKQFEAAAKTVEEAIEQGLQELGVSIGDVDVLVVEEGSKGLFGLFGSRLAKVRLTVKDSEEDPLGDLMLEEQKPAAKPEKKAEKKPEKKPVSAKKSEAKPAAKPAPAPAKKAAPASAKKPAAKAKKSAK